MLRLLRVELHWILGAWKSFKVDIRWQTYVFKTIGLPVLNCFLAKIIVKKIGSFVDF